MLKRNEEYSQDEKLLMVLHGSSFATYVANKDRDKYAKFKTGKKQELSDSDSRSMNVLSILNGLGYPMEELGTYLYKMVITEICDSLKGITGKKSDMEKCKNLLMQLNDGFSQFYHNVAREYLEMGVKSFHLYIQQAIEKINYKKVDLDLSYQIFGANPIEQSYGLQAFQLAAYTLGFCVKKEIHPPEVHPPIVKKLSNTPDDIKLKASI